MTNGFLGKAWNKISKPVTPDSEKVILTIINAIGTICSGLAFIYLMIDVGCQKVGFGVAGGLSVASFVGLFATYFTWVARSDPENKSYRWGLTIGSLAILIFIIVGMLATLNKYCSSAV